MSYDFDKNSRLESDRLTYRGIARADANNLIKWRSREDVYRYSVQASPTTAEKHAVWFSGYMSRADELRLIITDKESARDIGVVGGINEDGAFVLSYYIGEPQFRKKGMASEAIVTLTKWLSSATDISVIRAFVHPENVASIATLKKLGFQIADDGDGGKQLVLEYHI